MPSDAALYYPRIRIQDPNWLKMTLLSFGKVRRIIPAAYTADDSDEVRECCDTEGPNGPLVEGANLSAPEVQLALMRLRDRIDSADEKLTYKFTRNGYLEKSDRPDLVDSFEIHRMEIEPLAQLLLERKLAWKLDTRRGEEWLAVDPELGAVIMSTLAITCAKFHGASMVTPSLRAHAISNSLEGQLVLEELLGLIPMTQSDNAADLTQVVMQSVVTDVSKFTIKQISEMLMRQEDLISLRGALESMASQIPAMEDAERRSALVRKAAVRSIEEWQKSNSSPLAGLTKGIEISDGLYEIGEAVVELHFVKSAFKSVTFLFRLVTGEKGNDQRKNNYKFLNLLEHAANPRASWLTLPAFGKMA